MIPVGELTARVEELAAIPAERPLPADAGEVVAALLDALEAGTVRAAAVDGNGAWRAERWVKRGILLAFRAGRIIEMSPPDGLLSFVDKHTIPARRFVAADGVRIVPGGSSVRRGAYVAPGVVCMPPMFINVGAWVGAGTMVDSHALIGSCAQVGQRVHVSAAAQIGGVLEPINAAPVVVEDDVLVGGNCGVYEGTIVRARAVLAPGVILTRGTPVYDLVRQTVYRAGDATPLVIPEGAVVVPGAREVRAEWGGSAGERLSLQTPVIVKYRDERTDTATALERWLR
ncbi:MAG TPA: 2,3,4,5-tetrahydropyridine-2,6-dicarboxylate N-succinyltransferase [Gemmatimonadaceae bacterium]|nr:2,3,4,5-tetrahydropyridine-2,6-dicarboxylate N-succinyltransferase [Gemmatimonadaceae bacterium]